MIKNGLRTTFEIILQWREDWKNDQKWFENDNWDCGQNQNPPVMITTVFSGVKWCSMKQEMFFVEKRNSLTSKMEENGLMIKLFPLHFSHRWKKTFSIMYKNIKLPLQLTKVKHRINLTNVFRRIFFVKMNPKLINTVHFVRTRWQIRTSFLEKLKILVSQTYFIIA